MRYALVKNNVVHNVIVADPDYVSEISPEYDNVVLLDYPEEETVSGPGWTYNPTTGEFSPPVEPEPEVIETWKITKLAFKNRFPRAKWMASKAASAVDPNMDDFFETFNLATYIDLEREDTRADVTFLTGASIPESFRLTTEELDAIINTPARPDEIPSFL